jgi:PIN domain nuclease of toxin-antitoxin system
LRLLLDTHVAVWSVSSSRRLRADIIEVIADPSNEVFVSTVSLLEIALKNSARRRDPMPFPASIARVRFAEFGYEWLQLELPHIIALEALGISDGDPSDRLLIAQSHVSRLQFITHDAQIARRLETAVLF